MQRIKTLLALGALLGSAAAYATQCNLGTIEGTYAGTSTGWIGAGGDRKPTSGVRFRKFEIVGGVGTVTTPYSADVTDGVLATNPSVGTYTVSAVSKGACSVVMNITLPSAYGLTGVISDNGNHISGVCTNDGNTGSQEFVRVSN